MSKKITKQFAEDAENSDVQIAVPVPTEESGLIQARVKGTWTMVWGSSVYNFEDGKRYNIPKALHNHLRKYGNIYDTL